MTTVTDATLRRIFTVLTKWYLTTNQQYPADIANMAVFLASDAARLVSGQAITVDGHTEHPEPKF